MPLWSIIWSADFIQKCQITSPTVKISCYTSPSSLWYQGSKYVDFRTQILIWFWLNLGLPPYGNFSHCWEKDEQLQWIFCGCRCFYSRFKYLKISPQCVWLFSSRRHLACSRPKLDWFEKTTDLLFDPLCILWAVKRKSNALNFWSQAVYWSGNWVCISAANGWVRLYALSDRAKAEAQGPEYKHEKHLTTWESEAGSGTSIPCAFEQLFLLYCPEQQMRVRLETSKTVVP